MRTHHLAPTDARFSYASVAEQAQEKLALSPSNQGSVSQRTED